MKTLVISVIQLSLSDSGRTGTSVYIASLIEALQEISEIDVCLLDHAHSGLTQKHGRIQTFKIGPAAGFLARHWLSWSVGVKPTVWKYKSVALRDFLTGVKPQAYDVAVFLEENSAIYERFLPAKMPKVLVRHNLDSESIKIDKSTVANYARSLTGKFLSRRFDRWTLRKFNRTTIGTEPERELLQKLDMAAAVSLLPTITRFDLQRITSGAVHAKSDAFRAVFVGSFDYPPNLEAVHWFTQCQDYLPPELLAVLEVVLIGRFPPEIPPGCKIRFKPMGFVDDLFSALAQCQVAIIPIVSGSGVKIKSLTLLSSGLPVVTTSEGVQGIDVRHEMECLVANSQRDFASAIARLFADPSLGRKLQMNAHDFMQQHFSAQRQNEILLKIIQDAIGPRYVLEMA
jgi:glycosyltransferase involved in cell wall biosynthesis